MTTRLVVVAGVFALALALRWPYLMQAPRLTDETGEALWALRIARGEMLPATNLNTYIGPLFPYTLAALFKLFGESPLVPRAMMAVLGAALAGLVAWLAWSMAGEVVQQVAGGGQQAEGALPTACRVLPALLAGGLTATSFPLILVNSHIAWSNSITPLFTTAALGVTWLALASRRPAWLVVAGFLWGVALQTHPLVVPFLPGVALWFTLWPQGRRWLRTRWPWLAVGAFLLGYSNMLWVTIGSQGESITEATRGGHTFAPADNFTVLLDRLLAVGLQYGRMLAGSYSPVDTPDTTPLVVTAWVPLFSLLAVLALLWALRQPTLSLLAVVSLTASVILAWATRTWSLSRVYPAFYDTRYLTPLLPILYLLMATSIADCWWRVQRHGSGWRSMTGRQWLLTVLTTASMLIPLFELNGFYCESGARGLTNQPLFDVASAARSAAASGSLVILDKSADDYKLGSGGDTYSALDYLMTLDRTPFLGVKLDKTRYYLARSEAPLWLILGQTAVDELSAEFQLTPAPLSAPGFGVYRAPPGSPR